MRTKTFLWGGDIVPPTTEPAERRGVSSQGWTEGPLRVQLKATYSSNGLLPGGPIFQVAQGGALECLDPWAGPAPRARP